MASILRWHCLARYRAASIDIKAPISSLACELAHSSPKEARPRRSAIFPPRAKMPFRVASFTAGMGVAA